MSGDQSGKQYVLVCKAPGRWGKVEERVVLEKDLPVAKAEAIEEGFNVSTKRVRGSGRRRKQPELAASA